MAGHLAWREQHEPAAVGRCAALDRLHRSRIAWLAARAYPRGEARLLQIAADWTTLFCLLDDHIERLPGAAARVRCTIVGGQIAYQA